MIQHFLVKIVTNVTIPDKILKTISEGFMVSMKSIIHETNSIKVLKYHIEDNLRKNKYSLKLFINQRSYFINLRHQTYCVVIRSVSVSVSVVIPAPNVHISTF